MTVFVHANVECPLNANKKRCQMTESRITHCNLTEKYLSFSTCLDLFETFRSICRYHRMMPVCFFCQIAIAILASVIKQKICWKIE